MNNGLKRLLVLALLILPVACSDQLSDVQYLERAQDAIDVGDYGAAGVELKNALQKNPSNPQARRLLGLVHLELGDGAGAEKELRRADQFGVAKESVWPYLAKALLIQAKYEDLEELSPKVLSGRTAKAELLAVIGLGKLFQGNIAEAEEAIKAALSLDNGSSAYAGVAHARLLVALEKKEEAYSEIERILALDSEYAPAWAVLGRLQKSDNDLVGSEASLSKAIEYRIANTEDMLERVRLRIQAEKYDLAQADIDILKKRIPKSPEVHGQQGVIHLQKGELESAEASFLTSLKQDRRQTLPKYYLASINLRLGKFIQADEFSEQVYVAAPNNIAVRKLTAAIKLALGDPAEAEKLVRPVVAASQQDGRALTLLAMALTAQGQPDEAVPFLKRIVEMSPESGVAELRLGAALLADGRIDSGIARVKKALEKDSSLQEGRLILIRYYISQENLGEARRLADEFYESDPGSAASWNLLGALALREQDEIKAAKAFDQARELSPGDPTASHYLASLALKKKEYDRVRELYLDVLKHNKDHLRTLLKLALLDAAEKDEQGMVRYLQQAVSAHPTAVGPVMMLARYHLLNGEPEKVQPLTVEMSKAQKESAQILEILGYAHLSLKQFRDAKYNLEHLVRLEPEKFRYRFLLARAYGGVNDVDGLKRELRETVRIQPTHVPARLVLARLALLGNDNQAASEEINSLEKIVPKHPDVLALKAALARSTGDSRAAQGLLEELFEMSPTTNNMLSLAEEKWGAGDADAALALQEQWVEQHPDDVLSLLNLAGSYGHQSVVDKAIAGYKKVLHKDKDNVVALNELAWNLKDSQPSKALEYAQKAHRLAPESAVVLDTLAMVQLRNQQLEKAKRSIERALKKAPENRTVRFHTAVIAERTGDAWEATKTLSELLEDPAGFPEREQAEKMLKRLRSN